MPKKKKKKKQNKCHKKQNKTKNDVKYQTCNEDACPAQFFYMASSLTCLMLKNYV